MAQNGGARRFSKRYSTSKPSGLSPNVTKAPAKRESIVDFVMRSISTDSRASLDAYSLEARKYPDPVIFQGTRTLSQCSETQREALETLFRLFQPNDALNELTLDDLRKAYEKMGMIVNDDIKKHIEQLNRKSEKGENKLSTQTFAKGILNGSSHLFNTIFRPETDGIPGILDANMGRQTTMSPLRQDSVGSSIGSIKEVSDEVSDEEDVHEKKLDAELDDTSTAHVLSQFKLPYRVPRPDIFPPPMLKIHVVDAIGIESSGIMSGVMKRLDTSVEVRLGSTTKMTRIVTNSNKPVWNEEITISNPVMTEELELTVINSFFRTSHIGKTKRSVIHMKHNGERISIQAPLSLNKADKSKMMINYSLELHDECKNWIDAETAARESSQAKLPRCCVVC